MKKKILMIYTGGKKITVEKLGELSPGKGEHVQVNVPAEIAPNLSRDKYWAYANPGPHKEETPQTQPPATTGRQIQPPRETGKPEEQTGNKKGTTGKQAKPGNPKEKEGKQ